MLSDADVQALVQARHGDPFALLGLHADADGALWIRALLPRATQVALHETEHGGSAVKGRKIVALEQRHAEGLWEARVPRRRNRFDYRLNVHWDDGSQGRYADAYAFGTLISDADLHYFGEGSHLRPFTMLGALPMSVGAIDGVRFAVWAPNARRVSVVGEFNGWDGRRHMMRSRGGGGVWEIFVPHAAMGDRYKFELVGPSGALLPLKADPYARAAQTRPETASVVAALPPPQALPPGRAAAHRPDPPK
jgi:1,4-alpha-glucan branching enzyme